MEQQKTFDFDNSANELSISEFIQSDGLLYLTVLAKHEGWWKAKEIQLMVDATRK